ADPLISPADTHAARPARAAPPIQDRSSTVLLLPGGADITVTRPHHLIRSQRPRTGNDSYRTRTGDPVGSRLRTPGRQHSLLLARTSASAMPPQVTPDLRQA